MLYSKKLRWRRLIRRSYRKVFEELQKQIKQFQALRDQKTAVEAYSSRGVG